jgi:hypothetical protein
VACGGGWYQRHWFTLNSAIGGGDPTPVCIRCGAPRAKPLTEAEWKNLLYLRRSSSSTLTNPHVLAALSRHFGADFQ